MDINWTQISLTAVIVVFSVGSAWGALLMTFRHLKARVKTLEKEVKEQNAAEDVRHTHYDDIGNQLDDGIRDLENKLNRLEQDLYQYYQELPDIKSRITAGESSSTGAHKRVDSLEAALRTIQREITDNKQDLALLKDGVAMRLQYLSKAENTVSDLTISLHELKTKVDRNEQDIQKQGQTLEIQTLKIARLEARPGDHP